MSNALDQYRKECEEMRLAGMVWWLILWYASDEGKTEIPSEQEWLSCELVAAIIEEVTGEQWLYSWRFDIEGNELNHDWRAWSYELNMAMILLQKESRKMSQETIEGRMRLLLKKFTHLSFQTERDEKWFESELKQFHENHTPRPRGRSLFLPAREMVAESIRFLGGQGAEIYSEAMTLCEKIGTIMRPYIERDVAYIKKHYSW